LSIAVLGCGGVSDPRQGRRNTIFQSPGREEVGDGTEKEDRMCCGVEAT